MALRQRQVPAQSKSEFDNPLRFLNDNQHEVKFRLLRASEVPPWLATNHFILTGYRPVRGSVSFCFGSLLRIHNETVNIYSHLIPAVFAIASNYYLYYYWHDHYPSASSTDQLAIHVYLTTSVLCFGISSLYHTLDCHSRAVSSLWNRLDYAAIIVQTAGSFLSGIYVTFYCVPGLRMVYWIMTAVLGTLSAAVVVHPRFQGKPWRKVRVSTFVATGLSGLFPVIHASLIYPREELNRRAGVGYYLIEGLTLLLGAAVYAVCDRDLTLTTLIGTTEETKADCKQTHFPECWKPGKFDIWGASHQIFHFLVVISAGIHIWALLSVFEWIYNNPKCPS